LKGILARLASGVDKDEQHSVRSVVEEEEFWRSDAQHALEGVTPTASFSESSAMQQLHRPALWSLPEECVNPPRSDTDTDAATSERRNIMIADAAEKGVSLRLIPAGDATRMGLVAFVAPEQDADGTACIVFRRGALQLATFSIRCLRIVRDSSNPLLIMLIVANQHHEGPGMRIRFEDEGSLHAFEAMLGPASDVGVSSLVQIE
jgi:hypothetical protein